MSRRVSLPGADELFRTTGGGMGLQSSSPADRRRKANGEPRVPAPAGESDPSGQAPGAGGQGAAPADRAESREEHASAGTDDSRARSGEGDRRATAPAPSGDRSATAAQGSPRPSSSSAGEAADAARTGAPAAANATTRRSRSTSPPRS